MESGIRCGSCSDRCAKDGHGLSVPADSAVLTEGAESPRESGTDSLECLKYKPTKTNEITIIARITRIDSIIVKAEIFLLFMNFFV